ncbi:MAG: hypothetical protein HY368_03080 [Candidatus Aenigmarchaeota archaeon]|nr:hypothetical protein [Candidatus Aenigmarchaeota archaeon]
MPADLKVMAVLGIPDIGSDRTINQIMKDLDVLQEGGVDGLLIENHGDSADVFLRDQDVNRFLYRTMERIRPLISEELLMGFCKLPPDRYADSFRMPRNFGLDFVWMDTLVDRIRARYTHQPVEVKPDIGEVLRYKSESGLKILSEIQPGNFYELLERRPVEESAAAAVQAGADSIIVVRYKGFDEGSLEMARAVVGQGYPVGVTGGINARNIATYEGKAEYAVLYSSLRKDGIPENPVDASRLKAVRSALGRQA